MASPSPGWPNPTWGFGTVTDLIDDYHRVVPGASFYVTEVGTQDMNSQGEFPHHMFKALNSTDWTLHVWWFSWSDGMVDPFGVVDKNGKKKPSYASFQKYARTMQQNVMRDAVILSR